MSGRLLSPPCSLLSHLAPSSLFPVCRPCSLLGSACHGPACFAHCSSRDAVQDCDSKAAAEQGARLSLPYQKQEALQPEVRELGSVGRPMQAGCDLTSTATLALCAGIAFMSDLGSSPAALPTQTASIHFSVLAAKSMRDSAFLVATMQGSQHPFCSEAHAQGPEACSPGGAARFNTIPCQSSTLPGFDVCFGHQSCRGQRQGRGTMGMGCQALWPVLCALVPCTQQLCPKALLLHLSVCGGCLFDWLTSPTW